ncbi:MAG: hypothetical protein ACXIUZ_06030 [Lysobacteraceae bacterium]
MSTVPAPAALRRSAARLVAALRAHEDPEYRRTLLKRLVRALGEDRYPEFLALLCTVEGSDDAQAKALVADTLAGSLQRGDLPLGALNSWGSARLPEHAGPLTARQLSERFFSGTPSRSYGPLEYLVVWSQQKTQRTGLSPIQCRTTLARVVALIGHSPRARELYATRIRADAQSALEGAYTRGTRERLLALAEAWQQDAPPDAVARAACPEAAT